MSNAKHTLGPWSVFHPQGRAPSAFDQYAEGDNGEQFDIKIVSGNTVVAVVPASHKSGYSKVIAYKDARLIAAAPDYDEATEKLLSADPSKFANAAQFQQWAALIFKDAIVKARGE